MNNSGVMPESITIPKKEYLKLKKKARAFDDFVDSEELTKEELARIMAAKKTRLLTKEEVFGSEK